MEDQPTDRSDLTETAGKTATSGVEKPVPVGKRGGRHRYFRPRPPAATAAAADTVVGDAPTAETVEVESPTVDIESSATELTEASTAETATAEVETPATDESEAETTEVAPKPKRRGWFRRRPSPPPPAEAEESADDTVEVPVEDSDDTTEAAEWPDAEPVQPKQAGRRLAIAAAVAAALFVAAGAFGGAMLQPYLSDRAVADTKTDIARTATAAITTLFTYTPDDMDQLPARSAKYLGGELKEQYAKQVDALAATNKQNQIHRSAQVVGAAVESLNGPNATAVVYANITYNSAATKDVPKMFLVSYRLTMERKGSDWVITNMPWITSKDLTRLTP